MTDEELIDLLSVKVDGKNKEQNIQIFTLSTCQWCMRCKRYLNDKNVQYKYVDMDKIQYSQKAQILEYLRRNFEERISYPFVICDGKAIIGYDPNKYDEMIKTGDNS